LADREIGVLGCLLCAGEAPDFEDEVGDNGDVYGEK